MAFNWFFPQEVVDHKTPSRIEGISLNVEMRYRKEGAKLVISAANTLKLRYDTVATGVVFFHRFFMMQSFKEFNRWVVAGACLLLAGKVEETPKQCRVILKVLRSLLNDQQWAAYGSNPKEELITHERILLQTIKFDLQIDHPYLFILKFAKELKGRGDNPEVEKIVQAAWTFVNDSLVTTLSVQWEPRAVAVAFIYLAAKLNKHDLQSKYGSKSRSWWRQFVDTLDSHDLDSICHQVLDTYQDSGKEQSDDEEASKMLAMPPQPPSGPNGQVPLVSSAPSTQPGATWGTMSSSVASLMGPTTQSAIPNNTQFSQTFQLQSGIGMTTFTLANPLHALQNIQAASNMQSQSQYPASRPRPQLYPSITPQNPSPALVHPRMAQPLSLIRGGVYPPQQPGYAGTQPGGGYPSQVKPQPSYGFVRQTGTVNQSAMGYNPAQGAYPSLQPPAMVPPSNTTLIQKPYSNAPYHQSTLPQQGTTNQLMPSQIHQNTQYTNYVSQNVSYLPPGANVSTPPPPTGIVPGGRTPGYPPVVRSHTPSHGKPGSGGWGMR